MKKILILVFGNLKHDARVTRQINFLKTKYQLTVVCFDAYDDSGIEIIKIDPVKLTLPRKGLVSIFLLLGINKVAYGLLHGVEKHVASLAERKFDLIVANDVETLPFAFDISAGRSKIFFDAHEYAPRQFEDRLYWKIFFQRFTAALCKKYIPRVDGMSTINAGIANEYEKNFSVKPIIITNATDFVDLPVIERKEFPIRLVHHGIFTLSRQPHLMIDMMRLLDNRFTLDLIYMMPPSASSKTRESYNILKQKAEEAGNVKVLAPLKSSEIIPVVHNNYDVGIILVPPVNFNYKNGLPNKLFDCIQARVAMCVGPLAEIARIVRHYDIGIVSEDFTPEKMATALKSLTLEKLNVFKQNTNTAAREMNAGINKQIFLEAIQKII